MGTIVVGKIEAGHLKKGQAVILMPNKVNNAGQKKNHAKN